MLLYSRRWSELVGGLDGQAGCRSGHVVGETPGSLAPSAVSRDVGVGGAAGSLRGQGGQTPEGLEWGLWVSTRVRD